jgi:hypothetical protein
VKERESRICEGEWKTEIYVWELESEDMSWENMKDEDVWRKNGNMESIERNRRWGSIEVELGDEDV